MSHDQIALLGARQVEVAHEAIARIVIVAVALVVRVRALTVASAHLVVVAGFSPHTGSRPAAQHALVLKHAAVATWRRPQSISRPTANVFGVREPIGDSGEHK